MDAALLSLTWGQLIASTLTHAKPDDLELLAVDSKEQFVAWLRSRLDCKLLCTIAQDRIVEPKKYTQTERNVKDKIEYRRCGVADLCAEQLEAIIRDLPLVDQANARVCCQTMCYCTGVVARLVHDKTCPMLSLEEIGGSALFHHTSGWFGGHYGLTFMFEFVLSDFCWIPELDAQNNVWVPFCVLSVDATDEELQGNNKVPWLALSVQVPNPHEIHFFLEEYDCTDNDTTSRGHAIKTSMPGAIKNEVVLEMIIVKESVGSATDLLAFCVRLQGGSWDRTTWRTPHEPITSNRVDDLLRGPRACRPLVAVEFEWKAELDDICVGSTGFKKIKMYDVAMWPPLIMQ